MRGRQVDWVWIDEARWFIPYGSGVEIQEEICMFSSTKRITALESKLNDQRKQIADLEVAVFEPRLQKLLDEYLTYFPSCSLNWTPRVSGKYITQYNGYDYTSWTEEEFRMQKLNPLKAKALDDHKCPDVPGMNPEPRDFIGFPSQEFPVTCTYTVGVGEPTPKKKKKGKR